MSIVKVLYVFVDHLAGWFIRVQPAKRRGRTVVIERGWWDMAVDPLRYRLQGVESVLLRFGALLPRPDLHVILHADPELLLQRKSEISEVELARQMARWRNLPTQRGTLFVDCSAPADEVVQTILDALNARMSSV